MDEFWPLDDYLLSSLLTKFIVVSKRMDEKWTHWCQTQTVKLRIITATTFPEIKSQIRLSGFAR